MFGVELPGALTMHDMRSGKGGFKCFIRFLKADLAPPQPLGNPVGKQSQIAQSSLSSAKTGKDKVVSTKENKKNELKLFFFMACPYLLSLNAAISDSISPERVLRLLSSSCFGFCPFIAWANFPPVVLEMLCLAPA